MKHFNKWVALLPLGYCLSAAPAFSASLTLVSPVVNVDADPISEIGTAPGQTLNFPVFLDTNGLSNPLARISYLVGFDPTELTPTFASADLFGQFSSFTSQSVPFNGYTVSLIDYQGGNIPAGQVSLLSGYSFLVLPGVNNDGLFDFGIQIVDAYDTSGNQVMNLFQPPGTLLEVQPQQVPEPPFTFGLLTFAALAIKMICTYKQKQKLSPFMLKE